MPQTPQLHGPYLPPKSGKATSLVIFLHGYGSNGLDLLSIGMDWADELPDTAFASPNAPDVCEAFAGGHQWFSIQALGGVTRSSLDRKDLIQKPAAILNGFIDAQLQHWGLDESKLVVIGFSQGAMMAMYTMPRRKKPCAGAVGWSGMLVDPLGLRAPGIVKMPILAIHGDKDEVVPPACLADVQSGFESAGFDVETIMRPGLGHNVDQFGLERVLAFVQEVVNTDAAAKKAQV